jgi:hypothetical protein
MLILLVIDHVSWINEEKVKPLICELTFIVSIRISFGVEL